MNIMLGGKQSAANNIPSLSNNTQNQSSKNSDKNPNENGWQRKPNKKIFNEETWTHHEQQKGEGSTKSFYEGNRQPAAVSSRENNDDDKIEPQSQTLADQQEQAEESEISTISASQTADTVVETTTETEDVNCPICKIDVVDGVNCICCDNCDIWYHAECLNMSDEELESNSGAPIRWVCSRCQHIKANNLKWGTIHGEEGIR